MRTLLAHAVGICGKEPLRLVMAVNFWWRSAFDHLLEATSNEPGVGMEEYYARRLMEALVRKELQRRILELHHGDIHKRKRYECSGAENEAKEPERKLRKRSQELPEASPPVSPPSLGEDERGSDEHHLKNRRLQETARLLIASTKETFTARHARTWLRACDDGDMLMQCLEEAIDISPADFARFVTSLNDMDTHVLLTRLQMDAPMDEHDPYEYPTLPDA